MVTLTFLYTRNVKDNEAKYPDLSADTYSCKMFKNIAASTGGIAGASQVSHVATKLKIK